MKTFFHQFIFLLAISTPSLSIGQGLPTVVHVTDFGGPYTTIQVEHAGTFTPPLVVVRPVPDPDDCPCCGETEDDDDGD